MSSAVTESATPTAAPKGVGRVLAIALVAAFFSNLPIYLHLFVVPTIRPLHWMFVVVALFLALWFRSSFWLHRFSVGLPIWVAAYAVMCIVWFTAFGGGDSEIVRQRIVAMIFLLIAYAGISASSSAIAAARQTMLVVVIASVAINAYDISHPFVMIPSGSEFATLGRAAGLYGNPNQAGAALVLGFVLTLGIVPTRWRAAYLAYVGVGVVLTLSRGAMTGLAIVLIALWSQRMLTTRQLLGAALMGGLACWLAAAYLLPMLAQQFNLDPSIAIDRLLWIVNPESRADFSQLERAYLADRGWQQFLSAPVFGNGIGSTEMWDARASTHNTYVMLLSDFGVLGILVLPVLVFVIIGGPSSMAVSERVAFALFVLLWGAVSHNVLTEYYILVGFATMAAMCATSTAVVKRNQITVSPNIARPR